MKLAVLFLAALAAAAPPDHDVNRDKLIITAESYPEDNVLYTGEHEIVDIVIPYNKINTESTQYTIFFVEADVKDNGVKEYKGVYVRKGDTVKKLLDNGQCVTYANNYTAYFGAKDGIYKYNHVDQTATKFGTVTDSVIKMATCNGTEVYYLTEHYVLYKYNEGELKTSKVEAVKDARDIVIDGGCNLYYYDETKQFYTYSGVNVKRIEGLPANFTNIVFIRNDPMIKLINRCVVIIDGLDYFLYADDGKSVYNNIESQILINAYTNYPLGELFAIKNKIYKCRSFRETFDSEVMKCF